MAWFFWFVAIHVTIRRNLEYFHIRCKILLDLPVRSIVFFPPPLPLPGEEEEEEEAADEASSSLTSTRLEALKVNSSSPLLPAFFEGVASELSLEVRFSICSI